MTILQGQQCNDYEIFGGAMVISVYIIALGKINAD